MHAVDLLLVSSVDQLRVEVGIGDHFVGRGDLLDDSRQPIFQALCVPGGELPVHLREDGEFHAPAGERLHEDLRSHPETQMFFNVVGVHESLQIVHGHLKCNVRMKSNSLHFDVKWTTHLISKQENCNVK